MKHKSVFIFLLAAGAVLLASCTKSPTSPNGSANLIQNSTFRSGDSPSLAGWSISDTAYVKVVSNAPAGSAGWSLWLAPQFGPFAGGTAGTSVAVQSGEAVYTFSCFEKNVSGSFGNWGVVNMSLTRNGQTVSSRQLSMPDTSWNMFTLSDTLNVQPGDTLAIGLSTAGVTVSPVGSSTPAPATNGICFNQVSLTKS